MKKFIYGSLLFFAVQIGFAQSQDAKTFVTNMGASEQINGAKEQILPLIKEGKEADFKKEFDTTANEFITSFSKIVDETFNMDEIKAANKKFAETKEMTQVMPKDMVAFQEKMTTLQTETDVLIQGLVMKYGNEEALKAMQE